MEPTVELIALLMVVAFAAGGIDAMAGGGGLLTIPALLACGVPPVAAIATNKLQASFGTAAACAAFWRAGHIDLRRFAWAAVAAFAGSVLGALALHWQDPAFLAGVIPLLLVAMALYFLFAPRMSEQDRRARLGPAGLLLVLAAIGAYDGFFGPGTGSFLTTALVTLGGLGLVRAIAQAKLLNLASNLAALTVMMAGGHVLWTLGLAMAVANMAGAHAGAHAAMRFGGGLVRPLLVLMSLALTARLLADPDNPVRSFLGRLAG